MEANHKYCALFIQNVAKFVNCFETNLTINDDSHFLQNRTTIIPQSKHIHWSVQRLVIITVVLDVAVVELEAGVVLDDCAVDDEAAVDDDSVVCDAEDDEADDSVVESEYLLFRWLMNCW